MDMGAEEVNTTLSGARRGAGVLEQYVEHGKQALRKKSEVMVAASNASAFCITNHEIRNTNHGLFRHFFWSEPILRPWFFTNHETRDTNHGLIVSEGAFRPPGRF